MQEERKKRSITSGPQFDQSTIQFENPEISGKVSSIYIYNIPANGQGKLLTLINK